MADVTGTLHHSFRGDDYALRLTLGGIGKLQGKHGNDLAGLLSGKFDVPESAPEGFKAPVPPFSVMIDIVAVALEKGQKLSPDVAADLADEMLTEDQSIVPKIMKAAFPDPKPGNAATPTKAKR